MSDPLAPLRDSLNSRDVPVLRNGLGSSAGEDSEEYENPSVYEAFKAVDRRRLRLNIRPAVGACEWVTYSYLLHMTHDPQGTYIGVVLTFMTVVVKGRNLHSVADAIAQERCDFIQAYDPGKWNRPKDTSAVLIESIEVQARDIFSEQTESSAW